ncbi:HNH endonuclease [Corynebacterium sp. TA-R-1]|uniref:HNH endonuclease n=1 Tax=Corynebacterium stercoris TaxID=2943490 RepID=A0ABT1FZF9_9CORY|nr:HNH endonuclease signature motif containing protein [Corynebacterium stercoris]MCP1387154.1 HNH endonuclease [Corynebacterium stercoris]
MTTTNTHPEADLATAEGLEHAHLVAEAIRTHHTLTNTARADLLDCIAEFDELELAGLFGATSTGNWLTRELRFASSTAYEYVHVATWLRRFPKLAHALRHGLVDYSAVRFLIKYITHDTEDHLVTLAEDLCFAELKKALAGCEPNDEHTTDPDEPYLNLHERADGMLKGHFFLPPVIGALLQSALKIAELAAGGQHQPDPAQLHTLITDLTGGVIDHTTGDTDMLDPDAGYSEDDHPFDTNEEDTEDARGDHNDHEEDTEDAHDDPAAWAGLEFSFDDAFDDTDADVDMDTPVEVHPGVMLTPPRKDTTLTTEKILRLPSRFGPPQTQNLYKAFVTMINIVRAQPITTTRAPGADVSIIVTEDGRAWMPQNPQTPNTALIGYVHNAEARVHLLSTSGVTLHYGRRRRTASDAQIKALLEVWGNQCAMPGCTHARFIEIHHIHQWANGGLTDIDNLIPLCSACHSLVSHGTAHITPQGPDLKFRFHNGTTYLSPNRTLPQITA